MLVLKGWHMINNRHASANRKNLTLIL